MRKLLGNGFFMSKYCRRYHGIMASETQKIFRGRCKQWDCSYCARENKTAWRKAIRRAILENPILKNQQWVMLTFTMPPYIHNSTAPVLESAKVIKTQWNKFLTRFKKYYETRRRLWCQYAGEKYTAQKLTYIRVLENHKSGVLHIHFLVNLEISLFELYFNPKNENDIRLKWLKQKTEINGAEMQVIESYGFGWKHHVLMLDTAEYAINYVTKYLTKDSDGAEIFGEILRQTKIRRIQTSRDIKAPKSINDETWKPRAFLNQSDFENGEIWRDLNLRRNISAVDVDENGIYPPLSEWVEEN